MKSVYLINGGMDADAFGILSGTCEKELARRGVKTDARDGYGIRVAVVRALQTIRSVCFPERTARRCPAQPCRRCSTGSGFCSAD